MTEGFLFQALIYLSAAVLCVPISKKLGLSSVLGYLLAGMLIGPFVLGFIGDEGEDIMHFAEFGVVMMLFIIGLELSPGKFWRMRKMVVGMGGSQVLTSMLLFFIIGMLLGLSWQVSLCVGMALSLSSTAIVLQSLNEKGQLNTTIGQSSFSVLLFQDIAVIPMLALLPMLGDLATLGDSGHTSILAHWPAWMQTLGVFAAVLFVVGAGRYLVVPALRLVSQTRLRELFAGSALLIVIAIAFLMQLVGLSPALGAFLGGVVLANSEFRHELESDLEPFKGILLGLFFIAVGASIDFALIIQEPLTMILIVLGVMFLKALILLVIGSAFKLKLDQNLIFSIGLAQVGEFAFVIFSFASQLGILDGTISSLMMAVTAISMTISPLLNILAERMAPSFFKAETVHKEADAISENNEIILVGFSQFGSTVGRFLRAHGIEATVLDHDSDRVELLRKLGFKVYYGDATRYDLLHSAGADHAKILISAVNNPETNLKLTETVKKHFPHLDLIVRVSSRNDAYDLVNHGVQKMYLESLDTSTRLAVNVLKQLGFRSYSLTRNKYNFIKYDELSIQKLAEKRGDLKNYISSAKAEIKFQEDSIKEDLVSFLSTEDNAWDSSPMRAKD
jgi:CPA2 family monovalent cation:H+ antiporter-2